MHWDILDQERKAVLPILKAIVGDSFYLAGGTALALHIGHRDSIDFDFFTADGFDTMKLFDMVAESFASSGLKVVKYQEEKNTLGIYIGKSIKVSFMTYPYSQIRPLVSTEFFSLASIEDIACMKCSAITSRSVTKDYVDLYFILQRIDLVDLLDMCQKKFPNIDSNLILKSLVYFDDIENEGIVYKEGNDVEFSQVTEFLKERARLYRV
jgi:hypothetical protein